MVDRPNGSFFGWCRRKFLALIFLAHYVVGGKLLGELLKARGNWKKRIFPPSTLNTRLNFPPLGPFNPCGWDREFLLSTPSPSPKKIISIVDMNTGGKFDDPNHPGIPNPPPPSEAAGARLPKDPGPGSQLGDNHHRPNPRGLRCDLFPHSKKLTAKFMTQSK